MKLFSYKKKLTDFLRPPEKKINTFHHGGPNLRFWGSSGFQWPFAKVILIVASINFWKLSQNWALARLGGAAELICFLSNEKMGVVFFLEGMCYLGRELLNHQATNGRKLKLNSSQSEKNLQLVHIQSSIHFDINSLFHFCRLCQFSPFDLWNPNWEGGWDDEISWYWLIWATGCCNIMWGRLDIWVWKDNYRRIIRYWYRWYDTLVSTLKFSQCVCCTVYLSMPYIELFLSIHVRSRVA